MPTPTGWPTHGSPTTASTPANSDDHATVMASGYTAIEEYVNGLSDELVGATPITVPIAAAPDADTGETSAVPDDDSTSSIAPAAKPDDGASPAERTTRRPPPWSAATTPATATTPTPLPSSPWSCPLCALVVAGFALHAANRRPAAVVAATALRRRVRVFRCLTPPTKGANAHEHSTSPDPAQHHRARADVALAQRFSRMLLFVVALALTGAAAAVRNPMEPMPQRPTRQCRRPILVLRRPILVLRPTDPGASAGDRATRMDPSA